MATIQHRLHTDQTGQQFTIRTAEPDDAETMLAYIRHVAQQTEFFVILPDEFPPTAEVEQTWIQDHLDRPDWIALLAEADGQIIGTLSFEAETFQRIRHRGSLGISVAETWRRRGVGTALLQSLLNWAAENPGIEKVCLEVFATNPRAIGLYKKLGFVEEGRKVKDIKRGTDDYVDTIIMCRFVK